MSKPSMHAFRWSEREFSLKEVVADYRQLVPFALLVTQGYSGHDDLTSSSTNEVYWVHDIVKRSWLMLKEKNGKRYRVPMEYDAMVTPVKANNTDGQPISFDQVFLHDCKYIKFCDPDRDVMDEERTRQPRSLTELRIIEKYSQETLVVHSIFTDHILKHGECIPSIRHLPQGVIYPNFTLLPPDLPIKVSLGLSMNMANPDTMFFFVMADIKQIADSYPHDYHQYMRRTAEIEHYDPEVNQMFRRRKRNEPTPVSLRNEPVVLRKDVDPYRRLKELRQFYDGKTSGIGRQNRQTMAGLISWSPDMTSPPEVDDRRTMTSVLNIAQTEDIGARRSVARPPGAVRRIDPARARASVAVVEHAFGPSGSELARRPARLSDVPQRTVPERSSSDTPDDIRDFSVDDVIDSLGLLRLSQHANAIRTKHVDGRQLAKLPEETLQRDLGFSRSGAKTLVDFVRSKTRLSSGFDLDTVRRKLPDNSYVTMHE